MAASSTTPTPPTRVDWTLSGACTRGSTARPRDATRPVSGGGATTSTRRELPNCFLTAVCRQRRGHGGLGRVYVGDGRHADARWLDDVDGLDADARAVVRLHDDVVPRHVGRDAAGDGAHAAALPRGGGWHRRRASRLADHTRRRGVLHRVDPDWRRGVPAGYRDREDGDAATGAGSYRADRGRCRDSARGRLPILGVEGTAPCVLPV